MTQTPTDALRLVPVSGADIQALRELTRIEYYAGKDEWAGALERIIAHLTAPASPLPGGLPPISLDGPHEIDFHRQWLARQLLDSKLDDEEAYSIVRHDPAIKLPAAPTGEPK